MQNFLPCSEYCSKHGEELTGTALWLSQPWVDRVGHDVRRPGGWLSFLGRPENREAVQVSC